MGWFKDFFGGKSIFSYSQNNTMQQLGRISEHVDTMGVASASSAMGHLIIKESREVEAQIGAEYRKLNAFLNEEESDLEPLSSNIDKRRLLLKKWYREITSDALHKEIDTLKERLSVVIAIGEYFHPPTFRTHYKDVSEVRRDLKELARLLDEVERQEMRVDNMNSGSDSSPAKKSAKGILENCKVETRSLKGKIRYSEKKLDELKLFNSQLTKENIEEVLKCLASLTSFIPRVKITYEKVIATPSYNVIQPSLTIYMQELDHQIDNLRKLSLSIENQRKEMAKIVVGDPNLGPFNDEMGARLKKILGA